MLTLVLVLVAAACIGAFVHRSAAASQPATERDGTHRGRPGAAGSEQPADAGPTALVRFVRRRRARRAERRARPFPPWWRRLLSLVELVVMVALAGALAAAVIGAVVVLLGAALSTTVD